MRRALPLVAMLALLAAPAARAQEVRTAIAPDTATVGAVVRVAVRVDAPAEARFVFPDTLPLTGPLENAARVEERVEEAPGGGKRVTAVYAVTGWRPGVHPLPAVPVQIGQAGDARTLMAALPALTLVSVLPADTAGIEPRPAAPVIGRNWSPWTVAIAGLLLVLLLAALFWWLHRRRKRSLATPASALSPRERVAAALDDLAAADPTHAKPYYSALSEALRRYLAALDPAWGVDLTTAELRLRMEEAGAGAAGAELGPVLERADLVKFARLRPDADTARADLDRSRQWVERFQWPPAAEPVEADAPEVAA